MIIRVCCGTISAKRGELVFDVDSYSDKHGHCVRKGVENMAIDLLHKTMNDDSFMDDGCRNEDAVNLCIALHVLGYDPQAWFEGWIGEYDSYFWDSDIQRFEEHIERVVPYLEKWGPANNRARALSYAI